MPSIFNNPHLPESLPRRNAYQPVCLTPGARRIGYFTLGATQIMHAMKTLILIRAVAFAALGILLSGCSSTNRPVSSRPKIQRMTVDWEQVWSEPAAVEVFRMKPVPLVAGGEDKTAWVRVPDLFTKQPAMIFMATGPVNGVADYKVTKGGYLLVACDYTYKGNSSGSWLEERWTRQQFYKHGWREATAKDLGGVLVSGDNHRQVVFVKKVVAGESGRLRCNKYGPPHFIVCSTESVK